MNPYLLGAAAIGGVMLAVALTLGGYKAGAAVEREKAQAKELARSEKIVVRLQREVVEVPKIVVRTVTQEKVIEKEVDRVVALIPYALAPDCVLPDRYGELLIGAARGIEPNPATGRIDEVARDYGCAEVLAATILDLKAGYKNYARLAGLQDFVRLTQ